MKLLRRPVLGLKGRSSLCVDLEVCAEDQEEEATQPQGVWREKPGVLLPRLLIVGTLEVWG